MKALNSLAWLLLSPKGRIRRSQWWLANLIKLVVHIPLMILIFYEDLYPQYLVPIGLFKLVMLYPAYAVDAKRFQDRGRSGFWALFGTSASILLIGNDWLWPEDIGEFTKPWTPVTGMALAIGAWFFIDLGCARGVVGRNRYGSDPLGTSLFSINQP